VSSVPDDAQPPGPPADLLARFRAAAEELHAAALEASNTGPASLEPGDICWAVPADGGALEDDQLVRPELVMVESAFTEDGDVDPDDPDIYVYLMSDCAQPLTPADVRVTSAQTGLAEPHAIAAELATVVLRSELTPAVGRVPAEQQERVSAVADGRAVGDGPPMLDRHDGRLARRREQLASLHRLGAASWSRALAHEAEGTDEHEGPLHGEVLPLVADLAAYRRTKDVALRISGPDLAVAAATRATSTSIVSAGLDDQKTRIEVVAVPLGDGGWDLRVGWLSGPPIAWNTTVLHEDGDFERFEWPADQPFGSAELESFVRRAITNEPG
jgi:hypothetical protein